MKDGVIIKKYCSIDYAMRMINDNGFQAVLVVDDDDHLIGVATDGDIRRWIINGNSLDSLIIDAMNSHPIFAYNNFTDQKIKSIITDNALNILPILDYDHRIIKVVRNIDFIHKTQVDNTVVLMAGGLGSRLRDITRNCPKPLLNVGKKPILETIIEEFKNQGFYDFYIAVNYKAEMIENYFEAGERLGVSIKYIHENEKKGTAGALSLLPDGVTYPIIVMNGDILTKVNYLDLLNAFSNENVSATVGLREYQEKIPYGVVRIDDSNSRIVGIEEKPEKKYLVNAGMYVLSKSAVEKVPQNKYYDMPQLLERLINDQDGVSGYPIRDYWIDIGVIEDLNRAETDYYSYYG